MHINTNGLVQVTRISVHHIRIELHIYKLNNLECLWYMMILQIDTRNQKVTCS